MTASQLQAEQALLGNAQSNADTMRSLIVERDKYRDALVKIKATIQENLFFSDKLGRIDEIAHKTLET